MLGNLDKDKKIFILIGIPIFSFLGLFFATFYFQITAFFIIILSIGFLGFLRKRRFWLQLTKAGLLVFVFYLIMFNNVVQTPSQIARRMPGGRQALIEPNNPKIEELRQKFLIWDNNTYPSNNFTSLSDSIRLELEEKLDRVDDYIHGHNYSLIEYTYDTNAPYYYYDYLPTIDEIFASDTDGDGQLQDDCDGITLVTCSLLIHMGYNAWIAEVEIHYHTMVFPGGADPHTEAGFNQRVNLYNSDNRPAYIMFNTEELIIPPTRPIYLSFWDVFLADSIYRYIADFLTGDLIGVNSYLMLIIDAVAIFIIAMALTLFVKAGESLKALEKKIRRNKLLKITFMNSIILAVGMFLIYFFSTYGFGYLGSLTLGILLISIFRITDYAIKRISR